MAPEHRSLLSKVVIKDGKNTDVVYSFSPSRFKFWLSVAIMILTLVTMVWGAKVGAYKAIEEFVHEKCGEYLAIFHDEVRPKLDAARAEDIEEALTAHEAVTSAEYNSNIHEIQMEQAAAIAEINIEMADHGATLKAMQRTDETQLELLHELIRRIPQ